MLTEPPSAPLDLLVVGGLTIDRFADGRAEPGGSVLHVARGLADQQVRLGVVTVIGPEPEAQPALDELRRLGAWVEATPGPVTSAFRHHEVPDGRRLWLERRGSSVVLGDNIAERLRVAAILFAPVAGEVDRGALQAWDEAWDEAWPRGAILQGWLRSLDAGEVQPLALATLDDELVTALAGFDLLVASREDLRAEAPDVLHQLKALRGRFGPNPCLVVTDGAAGAWISAPQSHVATRPWHVGVPRRVEGVETVGAGDVFAALMLTGLRAYQPGVGELNRLAESAMRIVARWLERRSDGGLPGAAERPLPADP